MHLKSQFLCCFFKLSLFCVINLYFLICSETNRKWARQIECNFRDSWCMTLLLGHKNKLAIFVILNTAGYHKGGSTFEHIFRKSWFICATFHSIYLRAYFSQVNFTVALIVFYFYARKCMVSANEIFEKLAQM